MSRTLDALTRYSSYEPTVGGIAGHAGQSYMQTQRELVELVERGIAVLVEPTKADGYQKRYRLASDAPKVEAPAPPADATRERDYLRRVLPGLTL